MRLKPWPRVLYTPNPLVEVVAQVRFPRLLEIDDRLPIEFQKAVRQDFPLFETQQEMVAFVISPMRGHSAPQGLSTPSDPPKGTTIYHFLSSDRAWRISLTSEFVALTCERYERWETFFAHVRTALQVVTDIYTPSVYTRVGLRYRDLIVRSELNLSDVPWRELIAPYLLGVATADALVETAALPEDAVLAMQSYACLMLEDCRVGLRHGLVEQESSGESCYLIDADFFEDAVHEFDHEVIHTQLDRFHSHAGALFRGCIQPRLHDALNPQRLE